MSTTKAKTLVNFRMPQDLVDAIDAAAQRAGLNRTEWVVSTLTVATREGLRQAALAVAAGHLVIEGCPHPKTAQRWVPQGLTCTACGWVLQRRYEGA